MSRKRLLGKAFLVAGAVTLAAGGPAAAQENADDPTISLVQTIEVREFEGLRFDTEEYTVQRGDSLVRVLQARGVMGRGVMPPQLMRLVKKLNPELAKNPDVLLIGQKLVLPRGPIEGLSPEPPAAATAEAPKAEAAAPAETTDEAKAEETAAEPSPGQVEKVNVPGLGEMEFKRVKVQKGDRLGELLRREGVPEELIFNEMTSLVVKVNRELYNPNVIYAGMDILVPVKKTWEAAAKSGVRFSTGVAAARPSAGTGAGTGTSATRPQRAASKPRTGTITAPTPPLPSSKHVGTRTALGLIFTRMGERYITAGQHYLPLKTGGQISINTTSFPILELNTGQRIILDLDHRLPKEMVEMIRTNYSNYTIYRPNKRDTLPKMLDSLFSEAQYHKVQRGKAWTLDRGVKIKINADWIVWPTQEDYDAGHATVINVPRNLREGTSPALAAFLARQGVQVIDFHPKGNMIGPEPAKDGNKAQMKVEDLRSHDTSAFIKSVLSLVGQKFESDLSIPLVSGSGKGEGFNFTVHAPIYFSRGKTNFVVDLEGMTPEMKDVLKKHKFQVVTREVGESPQDVARKLLATMKIKAKDGLTIQNSNGKGKQSIEVTMPGVLFNSGGKELLLTPETIPPTLSPLLNKPDLRVVQYLIADPS